MSYNKQFVQGHSLSEGFESDPKQARDAALIDIQMRFTGATCAFSAKLMTSDDLKDPETWDDLENSARAFTEPGTFSYHISKVSYVWIKLVVADDSSGANDGQLFATINVKGPL